jgi:hypothetical protein
MICEVGWSEIRHEFFSEGESGGVWMVGCVRREEGHSKL